MSVPHQRLLFYVPMPMMVWLISEYCAGTSQVKEQSLKDLNEMFDAHVMARERFLNVCRQDTSGAPEIQELIQFAQDTAPPPQT